jgi:hypothetical protein
LLLEPERSLTLILWWAALHVLLALALAALPGPVWVSGFLAAALLAHASFRFPRRPPVLALARDGTWSLPESGVSGLVLGAGSEIASAWVRLILVGPGTRRSVLLLKDQLSPQSWRALQAGLRLS